MKDKAKAKLWVKRELAKSKADPLKRIRAEEKTLALAKEYGLTNSEELWPHEELIRKLKELI
jgi:hypothetical protein